MAVTKIIPIRSTINKSIDYICNPKKTEECKYIFSEHCFPQTAAIEFEIYLRKAPAGNTIGRHLIQSFSPDETTPEQAHEIGKKLAAEILGGQYAYVMSTHIDRDHIHNHFVWCAVNLQTHKKYRSNKATYHYIQEVSDKLCSENSLSVITEKSGKRGKDYTEYQADKNNSSWKSQLRRAIDTAILSAKNYEAFLRFMQEAEYEIKYGKYISFRAKGQERFTRSKTIGDDYTEERIRERLQSEKMALQSKNNSNSSIQQVIDIESNEKIKSNPGYEHWARIYNLKANAKTLIYLKQHGMENIDEFNQRYQLAMSNFSAETTALSETNNRMKELEELQKHLRQYGRTRDNYKLYKAAKNQEKFLRENYGVEGDVMIHELARKHFDKYIDEHGNPLPKSKEVAAELASLKSLKTKQSADYRAAKAERDTMLKLKVNIQSILGKDSVKEYSAER